MTTEAVVDVLPVESEKLSPRAFLKLVQENPSLIKSSRIVHPQAGSRDFGSFEVVYTRPLYRSLVRLPAGKGLVFVKR